MVSSSKAIISRIEERNFRNIVGRLSPHRAGSLVILGAHFDSVQGTPGADDNASGVAVLLEAARLLARARVGSQVLFCAFNLEELNMIGSGYFAKKLKSAGAKVAAMISLEMVGYTDSRPGSQKYPLGLKAFYPDRGNFIGVIGNWRLGFVAPQIRSANAPGPRASGRDAVGARQWRFDSSSTAERPFIFLGRWLSGTHDYRHILFP